MGFFTPEIQKEVYIKAKECMDELLKNKKMSSSEVEVHLRLKLATIYDFQTAKKVASQIIHGW